MWILSVKDGIENSVDRITQLLSTELYTREDLENYPALYSQAQYDDDKNASGYFRTWILIKWISDDDWLAHDYFLPQTAYKEAGSK